MTLDTIRAERIAREKRAQERAEIIGPRKLYASGHHACDSETRESLVECESHWDACLVMVACGHLRNRNPS